MISLHTGRTAILSLIAAIAALVGMIADLWWLAALGLFSVAGVNVWTIVYARRRPDLVAEAQRNELERKPRRRSGA